MPEEQQPNLSDFFRKVEPSEGQEVNAINFFDTSQPSLFDTEEYREKSKKRQSDREAWCRARTSFHTGPLTKEEDLIARIFGETLPEVLANNRKEYGVDEG